MFENIKVSFKKILDEENFADGQDLAVNILFCYSLNELKSLLDICTFSYIYSALYVYIYIYIYILCIQKDIYLRKSFPKTNLCTFAI